MQDAPRAQKFRLLAYGVCEGCASMCFIVVHSYSGAYREALVQQLVLLAVYEVPKSHTKLVDTDYCNSQ